MKNKILTGFLLVLIAISCLTVGVQEEKTQADTMSKELLSFLNMRLTI